MSNSLVQLRRLRFATCVGLLLAAAPVHSAAGEGKDLRVDPIACTAHGLCAELLPEWVWMESYCPIFPCTNLKHNINSILKSMILNLFF